MAAVTVFVTSGTTASSQFVLDGRGSQIAIFINSHAANGWYVAFAQSSGGPFGRLYNQDGTAVVVSAAADVALMVTGRPSNWGRVETSSRTTATTSVTLVEQSWTA